MMIRFRSPLALMVLAAACTVLTGCPFFGLTSTPSLLVSPIALSFSAGTESFTIVNSGGGALTWSLAIDQAWLTADVASGTTTTETDRVHLSADTTGLATGVTYNATVTVTSNGGAQTVRVAVRVPGTPTVSVNPPAVSFTSTTLERVVTVTNGGDDSLQWSLTALNPEDLGSQIPIPEWLTVDPSTSSTPAGASTEITLTIDPETVDESIDQLILLLTSNAGNVAITLNLFGGDATAVTAVEPQILDFGTTYNELTFDVFNDGPTGSILDFTLSTDNPALISFSPAGGSSVGTESSTKNRVKITVTIDRNQLTSETGGGSITVSAQGQEDVEVGVEVERAPLTIEGAQNRSRPPGIARFVFTLRDQLAETIDVNNPNILAELSTAFTITEDEVPLDLDETNFFVTSGANLKHNLVLLLDYTGSMFGAGNGNGAAIAQMEDGAREFLRDVPAAWRVAVMEYHDKQQGNRVINGFTTDHEAAVDSLDAFSLLPGENGASTLYDALADACDRLANEDLGLSLFDDTDVRSIVFVTDGRDNASVKSESEVITLATELRCRLYPIGFGENPNTASLVRLATETGGHYYPATTSADLLNLLANESEFGADAPGEITKDLGRQIVLTYVSLASRGGTYLITVNYQNNEGFFQRDGIFFFGDYRAGQTTLTTTGIQPGNTAEVYVRTDYAPRAMTQIRFRVYAPAGIGIAVALDPQGLLADWILIDEGGGIFTALTDEEDPLPYAAFGNLFKITLTSTGTDPFNLNFRIDNLIYVSPPTARFWTYPFFITVGSGSSLATVPPLGVDETTLEPLFDPDAPFAFDYDADSVTDFNDLNPTNDLLP